MGDLKLFRVTPVAAEELEGSHAALEKSLQTLMEKHLDTLLGVRFLGSEYSTGKKHGGRLDTLGLDENGSPVIIEYKRRTDENVINQGLFYLDWLMDHQGEFQLLVTQMLGADAAKSIDWLNPRLICIAGEFTRYDEHAVGQINRAIELIRYRRFPGDLLALELLTSTTAKSTAAGLDAGTVTSSKSTTKTVTQYYEQASPSLKALFDAVESTLIGLGDDVTKKATQLYFAFRRIKNFACVEVHPQAQELLVYVKVDPDSIDVEPGFTRDVRKIGHFGTGDLEIRLRSEPDLSRALPLLVASYEAS